MSWLWPEIQDVLLPTVQMDVSQPKYDTYQDRVGNVLGNPVLHHPRNSDQNAVRCMDETERQTLANLLGKDEGEIKVVGFEYWDADGNGLTWRLCRFLFLLTGAVWSPGCFSLDWAIPLRIYVIQV